ncbi:MAG: hypothetical protein APR54_02765 [Candidatus Cloacimonas sp. SDB]|nr:MAG: hypothetical protein APR54_02765 [Candidatus Cloacimonas sp. SDB]
MRKSLIVLVLIVMKIFLFGDDFVIGSYSYFGENTDLTLFEYLSECNYNTHICQSSNQDIGDLYTKSLSNNLRMIFRDKRWEPNYDNPLLGYVGQELLTTSNYFRYEAEYDGDLIGFENPASKCYYKFTRGQEQGIRINDEENASNSHAWACFEGVHTAGLATDSLLWRWQNWIYTDTQNETGDWMDIPLESNIIFSSSAIDDQRIINQDTLYFEFYIGIDPLDHSGNEVICDLSIGVICDHEVRPLSRQFLV